MILNERSLYIHWPFCRHRCHFCPFIAYAGLDHLMERYHRALLKEIEESIQSGTRPQIDTIFMGGGTPSTYPGEFLKELFSTLYTKFEIARDAEVTIEVNPAGVRDEQIAVWKEAGINRLSIGVQSSNEKVLRDLNRPQTITDVTTLLERASAYFDNLSIDLIIGLPGVSDEEWKRTIETVVTWPITHMSIYFLTVYEGTALFYRVHKKDVAVPPEEGTVDLYLWTIDYVKRYGFEQYEICNFGLPGYRSRHNCVYWEHKPYRGYGVGACSFDGSRRYQNTKDIVFYLERVEQGKQREDFSEILTDEQLFLERVMLGLRQAKGIPLAWIVNRDTSPRAASIESVIGELKTAGYIRQVDGTVHLTPRGLMVENEIVMRLLQRGS